MKNTSVKKLLMSLLFAVLATISMAANPVDNSPPDLEQYGFQAENHEATAVHEWTLVAQHYEAETVLLALPELVMYRDYRSRLTVEKMFWKDIRHLNSRQESIINYKNPVKAINKHLISYSKRSLC